jgi:hypothetical protein
MNEVHIDESLTSLFTAATDLGYRHFNKSNVLDSPEAFTFQNRDLTTVLDAEIQRFKFCGARAGRLPKKSIMTRIGGGTIFAYAA